MVSVFGVSSDIEPYKESDYSVAAVEELGEVGKLQFSIFTSVQYIQILITTLDFSNINLLLKTPFGLHFIHINDSFIVDEETELKSQLGHVTIWILVLCDSNLVGLNSIFSKQ